MAVTNGLHANSTGVNVHTPIGFIYADQAAREAASLLPADVGKFAWQQDDDSIWILTDDSPLTWVAVGSGSSPGGGEVDQAVCQGRLTLTSGTAVTTTDVTAATNVYFTPLNGNKVALYDGADWAYHALTELTLSLAGLTANTNYDVFIYDSAGLTLEAVAWTNATTRATALALQDGVYVKTGATGRRYLGTFRTTGTIGQTEDSISKRFVWNYYNRAPRFMNVVDTTNTWTWDTASWRAANANAANKVDYVCGVSDELVTASVRVRMETGTTSAGAAGIGVDSAAANSAQLISDIRALATGAAANGGADYMGYPGLGYHYIQWIEYSRTGTVTVYGDAGVADQQSGLIAIING